MAIRFEDTGKRIDVRINSKLFGTITTNGRWPGRFKNKGVWVEEMSVSGEYLKQIADKCIEIRRQVDSTRGIRRTFFKQI